MAAHKGLQVQLTEDLTSFLFWSLRTPGMHVVHKLTYRQIIHAHTRRKKETARENDWDGSP